eukprot:2793985-Amphidinium_carterae.1
MICAIWRCVLTPKPLLPRKNAILSELPLPPLFLCRCSACGNGMAWVLHVRSSSATDFRDCGCAAGGSRRVYLRLSTSTAGQLEQAAKDVERK